MHKARVRVANPTTLLVERFLREGKDLIIAGKLRKKFPKEEWSELVSHVHLWLATWAHTGRCDEQILKGEMNADNRTITIFAVWAEQKFVHDLYRKGVDAANRNSGCRTQTEIRKRREGGLDDFLLDGVEKVDPTSPAELVRVGGRDDGTPVGGMHSMDWKDLRATGKVDGGLPLKQERDLWMDAVQVLWDSDAQTQAELAAFLDGCLSDSKEAGPEEEARLKKRRMKEVHTFIRTTLGVLKHIQGRGEVGLRELGPKVEKSVSLLRNRGLVIVEGKVRLTRSGSAAAEANSL